MTVRSGPFFLCTDLSCRICTPGSSYNKKVKKVQFNKMIYNLKNRQQLNWFFKNNINLIVWNQWLQGVKSAADKANCHQSAIKTLCLLTFATNFFIKCLFEFRYICFIDLVWMHASLHRKVLHGNVHRGGMGQRTTCRTALSWQTETAQITTLPFNWAVQERSSEELQDLRSRSFLAPVSWEQKSETAEETCSSKLHSCGMHEKQSHTLLGNSFYKF